MDLHLKDRVAIVTGGSRGLGQAICEGLAAEGAQVAIDYLSDPRAGIDLTEEAETLATRLNRQYGVGAAAIAADVSDAGQVERLFTETERRLGPPDVLINNAGIWPTAMAHEIEEADFRRVLEINLIGSFLTCRAAVRRWLEAGRGGRIVNITSPAAFQGSTTGHAHYAASKAGLVSFSLSLAREVAPQGIHVNLVAPGMTRTEMSRDALAAGESHYIQRIPLRRIAEPADIADVVVFLASQRAAYMTGATVDVTGGMLMR
ncbi:MAG: 3-oxoacyl-ACP reductase FabG [Pirellulaceae bacterium]|nr:3-oxoacyl-ACP reductase FabG [Pirellulaceae bacterium]